MTFENDMAQAQRTLESGQFKHAFRAAKSAARKKPRSPYPPNISGIALGRMGKHREAVIQFTKALKLDPQLTDARRNLAQTLILLGDIPKAVSLLKGLLAQIPTDSDGWYLLAQAHLASGQNELAVRAASTSIEHAPDQARGYRLRALAFANMAQNQAALDDHRKVSSLTPMDSTPHLEASVLLLHLMRTQEARDELAIAQKLSPDNPQVFNLVGMMAAMEGNSDDAISNYRKVVDLDPAHGEAFLQLALFQDQHQNTVMRERLETAFKGAAPKSHSLALLHFARAAIHKQSEDVNAEAEDLKLANRIESALRPSDQPREDALLAAMFSQVFEPPGVSGTSPVPIFVVGLPRSGTSLLEQILTASDQVFGCGELPMGAILSDLAGNPEAAGFADNKFAEFYRSCLPEMTGDTTHFVDKLPGNYKAIGPLLQAFPNARFLHLQRDPRDVALSMWRGYFAESGLNYTFDQMALAQEFNRYQRYMQHWMATCPDAILNLDYEEVVADATKAGRDMADFCGFEWSQAMAKPEQNTAHVRTASASQVRQKIHQRSVGGWRTMAPALATFIGALDTSLWPDLSD